MGNRFDSVIVDNLIEAVRAHKDIKKEGLTDVRGEPRIMARLKKAARKAKEVLNTIKEYTVHIEGVYKDYDLRGHILTRDEFDEWSANLYKRVLVPIEDAVRQSGLQKEDFEGIILMGGGSRLIGVQDMLQGYIPDKDLKKDLSTDEASVMGAAFTAANVSTSFKVRPIGLVDVTPFSVGVKVSNLSPEDEDFSKKGAIFKTNNKLQSSKSMRFVYDRDFRVQVHYLASEDSPQLPKGISTNIGSWAITGVEQVIKQMREAGIEGKPKIYVTLKLDKNSIITISKARGEWLESYEVRAEEKSSKAKQPADKADDAKKETSEEQDTEKKDSADDVTKKEEDKDKTEVKKQSGEEKEEGTSKTQTTESNKNASNSTNIVPEIKTRTKKVSLTVTYEGSDMLSFTESDFKASMKKLEDMDLRDIAVYENAAAKNKLESYIYEVKGIFEDDEKAIAKVATEEQIEEAMREVKKAEDWLWEVEPEEESAKLFRDKLKTTRKKADDILLRVVELGERAEAIKKALANIKVGKAATLEFKNRTAITDEERTKLTNQIESAEKWILEKIELQEKLSLTEKPAFKSAELVKRSESFKKFLTQLLRRREPKKKKKKKRKGLNETDSEQGDNSTVTKSDNETVSNDQNKTSDEKVSDDDASDLESSHDIKEDVDKEEL